MTAPEILKFVKSLVDLTLPENVKVILVVQDQSTVVILD
jgi:hypothetical protein